MYQKKMKGKRKLLALTLLFFMCFAHPLITVYASLYDDGYNEGYSEGEVAGYNGGYEQGREDGYSEGYMDGYQEGYDHRLDEEFDEVTSEPKEFHVKDLVGVMLPIIGCVLFFAIITRF